MNLTELKKLAETYGPNSSINVLTADLLEMIAVMEQMAEALGLAYPAIAPTAIVKEHFDNGMPLERCYINNITAEALASFTKLKGEE